jgi:TPP-dependent pyruvate/acetoin dehydrogenase alpha subunit
MKGHAEHDAQHYVDRAELEEWREKDPILRLERSWDARGAVPAGEREAVRAEEAAHLDGELAMAEASPAPLPETAYRGVFADESIGERARRGTFTGGLP